MRPLLSLLCALLLGACATMPGAPGHITQQTSDFDGSTQLSMEPAWLYNSPIKLGLYWNTQMPQDSLVLIAVVKGAERFASEHSLQFNVDGEILSFTSPDRLTDIETSSGFAGSGMYVPPSNWSSKRYWVARDFIRRIVEAEEVMVRVNLARERLEGPFSRSAPTTARPAFENFLQEMGPLG